MLWIFQYFSSLITKHNGRHNRHNHGRAPHEALHTSPTHRTDGQQPSKLADVFLGGEWGCVWPSKCSFVPAMMHHHNIGVFWGPYTSSTAPKIISPCLGGCQPFIRRIGLERNASCGALGAIFCRRRPWSAMVVLFDVGGWGLTSDRPTVGIVTIFYGSIFYSYIDPIHSWHPTHRLIKEALDLCTFDISWFSCPFCYGSSADV